MPKGNPPRELSLVETCIGDFALIDIAEDEKRV
jgi:hypothetical protein